jgi:sulfotransferase
MFAKPFKGRAKEPAVAVSPALDKRMVYVTGLPRAGSTLLCQLLDIHPDIYSRGHSSPLANLLEQLRHNLSDSPFLLAQLDVDFDLVYDRLINAFRGFINGWTAESDKPCVVDKNRSWLGMIQTVELLDPAFRMLVCIRDPVQVFGSVETQHQKTLLLDFPDHMAPNSAWLRGDTLFSNNGVIGGPMRTIETLQEIPDDVGLKERVYFVIFERLVNDPVGEMARIFAWLELANCPIDPRNLPVRPHESDSYYRFKYRHATHPGIRPPTLHRVSLRIAREVFNKYRWFYDSFYPDLYPELRGEQGTAGRFGETPGVAEPVPPATGP